MFTIWQMSREGVNNMLSLYIQIFQMFTVSHIFPCRGRKYVHFCTAIFQMFIVSHISPSRGKQRYNTSEIIVMDQVQRYMDGPRLLRMRLSEYIPQLSTRNVDLVP